MAVVPGSLGASQWPGPPGGRRPVRCCRTSGWLLIGQFAAEALEMEGRSRWIPSQAAGVRGWWDRFRHGPLGFLSVVRCQLSLNSRLELIMISAPACPSSWFFFFFWICPSSYRLAFSIKPSLIFPTSARAVRSRLDIFRAPPKHHHWHSSRISNATIRRRLSSIDRSYPTTQHVSCAHKLVRFDGYSEPR